MRNFAITIGLILLLALSITSIGAEERIGTDNCATCHPAQVEAWKDGPHSGTHYRLSVPKRGDYTCTGCHSPGLDKGVENVTCEDCHGGGRYYSKDHIMRDRMLSKALGLKHADMNVCLRCHRPDQPSLRQFDAKLFWKRLPHSKTAK